MPRTIPLTPRSPLDYCPVYAEPRHTGCHDPVVMLARLACHLGKEGRSEILGMALAMEVL